MIDRAIPNLEDNCLGYCLGYVKKNLMTFSSLDDVIKVVVFYSIFTKITTFEVYFVPRKIITDKIQ